MHLEMTLVLICKIHTDIFIWFDFGLCVGREFVTSGYFALDFSRILVHQQCLDLLLPGL